MSFRPLALASLAALALAGCASTASKPPGAAPVAAKGPLDQYPIPVAETPTQLQLAVHPAGLSLRQREAIRGFVADWRTAGAETITVQAPTDVRDAALARNSAEQTMDALMGLGVPAGRLRLVGYAAGRPDAPILAGFLKLEAQAPDCSKEWDNLVSTKDNAAYRAFGCSVSSNLAVQVANAHDLIAPAVTGPSDASRRQVVLDKYREGKMTSSEKDDQAKGTVSSSVSSN